MATLDGISLNLVPKRSSCYLMWVDEKSDNMLVITRVWAAGSGTEWSLWVKPPRQFPIGVCQKILG